MDTSKLAKLQTSRNARVEGEVANVITLEEAIRGCRAHIEERADEYRNLSSVDKKETIKRIIVDYVMEEKPKVEGFLDSSKNPEVNKIIDKLVEDITDYGILTAAMMDERIYEIRANGRGIKVEIEGRCTDLTDKDGNIIEFSSTEQQEIILKKLLGDVRLTPKDALVNARTVEGYRIAVVHRDATGEDPTDPTGERYHNFVLRKFKKSKMKLSDIIKFGTISDNMARFLALTTSGGLTTITAGPTASGKTSLLNALLQSVPPATRTVLIQNPSEIDMRFKDPSGRVYNDVIHLEAKEIDNPSPHDPTMANVMAHVLRLSPTYVVLGEVRSNKEFGMGMMIMSAGHPLYLSLHAENSKGAVMRFLRAYMADSNETIDTALPGLTDLLNIVVVQKIMKDGTRKVLQISEVIGVNPENRGEPLLNDLYRFEPEGDPVIDANGKVVSIPGRHVRVGKLSARVVRKMKLEGIPMKHFEFLTKDVSEDEREDYTGENVDSYGR